MDYVRTNRIGFARIFLTSLLLNQWIKLDVYCQVSGSGDYTTTDENKQTDFTTSKIPPHAITTEFTTDENKQTDFTTSKIPTHGITTEITTDENKQTDFTTSKISTHGITTEITTDENKPTDFTTCEILTQTEFTTEPTTTEFTTFSGSGDYTTTDENKPTDFTTSTTLTHAITTEFTTEPTTTEFATFVPCFTTCTEPNQVCVSHTCVCDDGFENVFGNCVVTCSTTACAEPNQICISGICVCDDGFENEDGNCVLPCHTTCIEPNQACVSSICVCDDGFENVNGNCVRTCPETCPSNSSCTNVENGCVCNDGYLSTTGECKDINECLTECNERDRICTNFPGYFSCECADGYYPDGAMCIEESSECPFSCLEHAACINPDVGCECVNGWTGNPNNCQDVDDCLTECEDPTLICTNTPGSFFCSCLNGYTPQEADAVSSGCVPEMCPEEEIPCSSAPEGLCDSSKVVVFPETRFGYSTRSDDTCGPSTRNSGKPFGTRFCSVIGSWEAPRFLSSCDEGLEDLLTASTETPEQRQEVSSNLEVLTSDPEELAVDDIETTAAVLGNITAAPNIEPVVATSVISTISNIAESPNLAESGQAQELLTQLDEVALKVVLRENEIYIAVSNNVSMVVTQASVLTSSPVGIGVALLERPDSSSLGFRADQLQLIDQAITSGNVLNKNMVQGSIYVPASAVKSSRVAVYVFGNDNLFPASSNQSSSENILSPNDTLVNSIIFSATVNGANVTDLPDDDLLIYSNPIESNASNGRPLCAFWNENVNAWSTEGCEVTNQTTNVSISCSCNHLTNFATLLDISSSSSSDPVLDVITIVGCSISSFALILTLVVFIFMPKTRKGRKFRGSFLLINLSISLLGLNITLLVSQMNFLTSPKNVDATKSSCIAVAALLHLFLLCTWSWMNCEATNLYLAVQKPLYSRIELRTSRLVLHSSIWGWLMPIVFVAITLIVNIHIYERPYGGEPKVTCWIEQDMVLYLAVIPVAIMLGYNLVIYGILTYSLCRNRQSSWGPTWKLEKNSMAKKLIVNCCLMVVVGVTWIFGILLSAFSFDETTSKVFAYIFTILNTLQGFFIFFLYIVRRKDVREHIKKGVFNLSDSVSANAYQNPGQTGRTKNRTSYTTGNKYGETISEVKRTSQTENTSEN